MPKISVELRVIVTLDIEEDIAKLVTNDDVIEMATSALGNIDGVQLIVDEVAQMTDLGDKKFPEMVDCYHEVDDMHDPEITDVDDGFDLITT